MIISSFSRNISLTKELLCCDLYGDSLSQKKVIRTHALAITFLRKVMFHTDDQKGKIVAAYLGYQLMQSLSTPQ